MAERITSAQVEEWAAFERRYGPVLLHERLDIGLAMLARMWSSGEHPLEDFLPTWWQWVEDAKEDDTYDEPDEAGQMIATMRAMAKKWAKRREEEASDGGERAGSPDHRRRDEPEARVHPGDGGD